MASTTSGTTSFNLDVDDIIDQALDCYTKDQRSGVDNERARRLLNLILINLQNKEIPLSKLGTEEIALTADTASYTLDAGIVDILEASISSDDITFIPLTRLGVRQWQKFPNKTTTGRPVQFVTDREREAVQLTVWPIPKEGCSMTALVSKKIEDITASYQKVDISTRYLPLLVGWLSYELGKTITGVSEEKLMRLEKDYKEILPDAKEEDRERVDLKIRLGGVSGR